MQGTRFPRDRDGHSNETRPTNQKQAGEAPLTNRKAWSRSSGRPSRRHQLFHLPNSSETRQLALGLRQKSQTYRGHCGVRRASGAMAAPDGASAADLFGPPRKQAGSVDRGPYTSTPDFSKPRLDRK